MNEQERQAHIERLEKTVAELQARMPTDEDMAYLRNMRVQAERMAWAKGVFKSYSPWAFTIASVIGSAIWALASGVMWVVENVSFKK